MTCQENQAIAPAAADAEISAMHDAVERALAPILGESLEIRITRTGGVGSGEFQIRACIEYEETMFAIG